MDVYIGLIFLFAGNFAPRGFMFCQGQTLSIAQYSALFSILGTTYGGNGTSNFQLPDLRGRVVVGSGNGPGLSPYIPGQMDGKENAQLSVQNMPAHNHNINCDQNLGTKLAPGPNHILATPNLAQGPVPTIFSAATRGNTTLNPGLAISPTGGSQPFSILQPFTSINYIIAVEGLFPSRN